MLKCNWSNYEFDIHQHSANWNDVAGIYIFAGRNLQNQWVPLYIGQASSLRNRLPNHERWMDAVRKGATHVHAKAVHAQQDRDNLEGLLIRTYQPTLNELLK